MCKKINLISLSKKINIISIRPFNIYGPGQIGEGAISNFVYNALKNKNIYVTDDGSSKRAWCFIDDFVNIILKIINSKFKKKLKMSKRFFSNPGMVKITCDVHNWMVGYVAVSKHPYITVTGNSGKFEISDVPAGKYKIKVWHEKLGKKEQMVTVKTSGKTELSIKMN